MKKILTFLLVMLLPCFLFLEVWSSYVYDKLFDEIAVLEETQEELSEKNKRVISGIAIYNAPDRIEAIAKRDLDLEQIDNSRKIKVEMNEGGRTDG